MLVLLTMVPKFWVLPFFYFQVWLDTTSILGCLYGRCVEIVSLFHWLPITMVQHRTGARGSIALEMAVKILWHRQHPWRQVCHNRHGVFSEKAKCKIFASLHSIALWENLKKKKNLSRKKGGKCVFGKKGFIAGNSSRLHICSRNGKRSWALSNHLIEIFSQNITSTFLNSGMVPFWIYTLSSS